MLDLNARELLTTTRSVRKRLDFSKPIARPLLEDCLELALQAPNGSNMNTWQWLIIDDPTTITSIASIYNAAMDDYVALLGDAVGENYMGADIPGFNKINQSVDYLRENLAKAPAILIPLMSGRVENAGVFMQASSYGSIIQAVWSFFLALRSQGLGSAWTTAHLWREQELAELLGIPFDQYTQVGLFPIAYTIGTDFKPAYRKPVKEVLAGTTSTIHNFVRDYLSCLNIRNKKKTISPAPIHYLMAVAVIPPVYLQTMPFGGTAFRDYLALKEKPSIRASRRLKRYSMVPVKTNPIQGLTHTTYQLIDSLTYW